MATDLLYAARWVERSILRRILSSETHVFAACLDGHSHPNLIKSQHQNAIPGTLPELRRNCRRAATIALTAAAENRTSDTRKQPEWGGRFAELRL